MSKYQDVGRSWRTYAKHELMNNVIGQEVGVVNNSKSQKFADVDRSVWIDLTAGNAELVDDPDSAVTSPWHRACSPGILASHATFSRKPVEIILHEIKPGTYDQLLTNLAEHLPDLGYEKDGENVWRFGETATVTALNISGQDADVSFIRRSDAAVVLNDANAITDWAMRSTFAAEICNRTWCFRSLSTMGCNPGGIKRLDLDERRRWFGHVETQQASLPRYRDLLLAAIEKDEAQWAYLLCTAAKWQRTSEKIVNSAFNTAIKKLPKESKGRTAAMTWNRGDPSGFEETKRRLFLTKPELEGGVE